MSKSERPPKKAVRRRTHQSSIVSQHSGGIEQDTWLVYLEQCKAQFLERYHGNTVCTETAKDFVFMKVIGKGTFGTVAVAKSVSSEDHYAIKIIEKKLIAKMSYIHQIDVEKRLLLAVRFPFIIHMEKYFMDNTYIFFVMPFIAGGDLFSALSRFGRFTEPTTAFYAAQLVLAFEYLHFMNVVYRDLKPENILIDEKGYIKLTDLGLAKIVTKRTYTLCGTPEFLAPEMILRKGYAHAVDWWALAVVIYEMCSGVPPFYSKNAAKIYESIVNRNVKYPSFFSNNMKALLEDMFQVDPSRRLGNLKGGVDDIKKHVWFSSVQWTDILNKLPVAPYLPMIMFEGDTSNFDEYGEVKLKRVTSDKYSKEFADF